MTIAAALAWVNRPDVDPSGPVASHRMTIARGFARHMAGLDANTEIPPSGLVGSRRRRREPYIFSPNDIDTLMTRAQGLRTQFASATHHTLIGLLAATGMRVGEAIRLDRGDVDEADATLMIHESKLGKSRMVPLQPAVLAALQRYARLRDDVYRQLKTVSFFVSTRGKQDRISNGPTRCSEISVTVQESVQMHPRRRGFTTCVTHLTGVSILMITVTGAYTRYVKPSMLPWLAAAGVLIIGLAIGAIVHDIRDGGCQHNHDHDDGHQHRAGIVWLLTIPIIVLIFVGPPALSARAVAPSVTAVSNSALRRPFPPLPPERAPAVPLPEVLMRIATDSSDTLDGRLITVTGFTMKDGDRTDLARIVIICCAADAQLARIRLTGPAAASAANHPENTWLSVEGTVPKGQRMTGTSSVPAMQVNRVTPIDPPPNPYG